jgi:hypothetical protein
MEDVSQAQFSLQATEYRLENGQGHSCPPRAFRRPVQIVATQTIDARIGPDPRKLARLHVLRLLLSRLNTRGITTL